MLSVEKLVSDPIVILGNKICLNIVNPFSCRACVLVFSFNCLFLFIYFMRITYRQRLLVALLNIDTDNNIMNNTKEYKLIKRKDNTI